jgi:hypothetical protein
MVTSMHLFRARGGGKSVSSENVVEKGMERQGVRGDSRIDLFCSKGLMRDLNGADSNPNTCNPAIS